MSQRVHTVLFSLLLFSIYSFAQTTPRPPVATGDNNQSAPTGWVWVTQTIDLSPPEVGNIMTRDGEPMPSMKRLRVTLGLVIDDLGHIVTRLINVTPNQQPIDITVRGTGSVTKARFLGMDTVTGLCVLKADDPTLKAAKFSANIFPPRLNIRLYGFHPKQASNLGLAMTSGYPRRNFYSGQIVKLGANPRFNNLPVYQLTAPQLTEAQDCSLILDRDDAVFGLAFYNLGEAGPQLVYPISQIMNIAQPIIRSNQSIAYGWLGASGRDIQAAANQSAEDSGVRLVAVAPDSPADVAGIKAEDILLSVNNRRVETWTQLASIMKQMPADSEVMLRVKRGSEYKHLRARLAPAPALEPEQQVVTFAQRLETMEEELKSMSPTDPKRSRQESKVGMMRNFLFAVSASPAPPEIRLRVFYGLEILPLTGQLMKYFAVSNGVLVASVTENNKAARAGLLAGDVILSADEVQINNLTGLIGALDQSSQVVLTVSRRREQLKIKFTR